MSESLGSGLGGSPRDPDVIKRHDLPAKTWETKSEWKAIKQTNPGFAKKYRKEVQAVYDRIWREQGKRVVVQQQLGVAKRFERYDKIWFPWNFDWRGRMYPIPPVLNPQSDDAGKALLRFAEPKKLGKAGPFWLAIHGANKYGEDKVPFAERNIWTHLNTEKICDSAKNPHEYTWWTEADDPWQFLAFCFEWNDMMNMPNIQEFGSRLPVSMDGTCNGLQNLSAMLRDAKGGTAVNLLPSSTPNDIYGEVAAVVQENLKHDVDKHEDPETREIARIWLSLVDRKWCKRNTMTVPYGVTDRGMVEQIVDDIKSYDPFPRGITKDNMYRAAIYLAQLNRKAIDTVIVAAKEVMTWLQDCSEILAEADRGIVWYTPLDFPCVQEYNKHETKRIKTFWGGIRLRLNMNHYLDTIDPKKQRLGVSPNFVHSFDATHLMMTVNRCVEAGIDAFSMIHDGYGVHATDVPVMRKILREAFVGLYSEDVLLDFKGQLESQSGLEMPPLPEYGDLDVRNVNNSEYFFA
jgi:DNA-directed RNA polymerase